ncbi:NfeD family protein [Aquisalinus flavus]|nr:nodulation protein NfeD [Aquisalinus flavus]MBD0426496.1 nodulation protein NfeD [Aquisalinus flavus]UNE47952.1 nodulation protein NfeD [Aquisalinus flavus]
MVRKIWQYACLGMVAIGLASLLANAVPSLTAQPDNTGIILDLKGPVTPTSAEYLSREIALAGTNGTDLVIIEIDTPGGLVTSMMDIVKSILGSDVPVVTYVSPQGSRSASAGLYIMYSAHVSAMAPATNTGAATPVELGGGGGGEPFEPPVDTAPEEDDTGDSAPADDEAGEDVPADEEAAPSGDQAPASETPALANDDAMRAKVINDSVAYIRSLAEKRGRNADWAESAVRDAASVTANEALDLGVIDLVADDLDDLLAQIDGMVVETATGEVTISTADIQLTRVEPQFWEKILGFFADPNVAAILLSLGTLGITAEIWNPGSIFPGALGLLCLMLAFYSFSILPHNALFFGFMAVGVILIVLEAYTPTFGISGLAGLALFGSGLYFLFPDQFRISPVVIITILAFTGAFLAMVLIAIVRSRSHRPLTGAENIRKLEGSVVEWNNEKGTGLVLVDGETWKARSKAPLKAGDRIKVVEIDGLVLDVKPVQNNSASLSRFMPGLGSQNS